MREQAAEGLHLGAFGVVENLLPDSSRPAEPGARQPRLRPRAVAAAGDDRGDAAQRPSWPTGRRPAAPSTSTCARTASSAPSGCSRASPTASRWRRCSAIASSARCATPAAAAHARAAGAPSRCGPPGRQASDEAQEAIAARDVVDGVRLMDDYRDAKAIVRDRRRAAAALTRAELARSRTSSTTCSIRWTRSPTCCSPRACSRWSAATWKARVRRC